MASDGTPLLRASAFMSDIDGAFTILAAAELAHRHDRVAKRDRDGDLVLREEADACGWSSAVLEGSLALRRRRGPASSCSRRGCGWVVGAAAEADEHVCRLEEAAAASGALRSETAAVKTAMIDSGDPFFYLSVL